MRRVVAVVAVAMLLTGCAGSLSMFMSGLAMPSFSTGASYPSGPEEWKPLRPQTFEDCVIHMKNSVDLPLEEIEKACKEEGT